MVSETVIDEPEFTPTLGAVAWVSIHEDGDATIENRSFQVQTPECIYFEPPDGLIPGVMVLKMLTGKTWDGQAKKFRLKPAAIMIMSTHEIQEFNYRAPGATVARRKGVRVKAKMIAEFPVRSDVIGSKEILAMAIDSKQAVG